MRDVRHRALKETSQPGRAGIMRRLAGRRAAATGSPARLDQCSFAAGSAVQVVLLCSKCGAWSGWLLEFVSLLCVLFVERWFMAADL